MMNSSSRCGKVLFFLLVAKLGIERRMQRVSDSKVLANEWWPVIVVRCRAVLWSELSALLVGKTEDSRI